MQIDFPHHEPYENNLHHIVGDFIKGDCSYWLSMDSDNPPRNNPLDLVALDLDIIGLPTPVWNNGVHWNAYVRDPSSDAYKECLVRDGLQQVDVVGTGCFLIARRVFEHPELQKGAFVRKLNPDGTVDKGNDFSFCERARGCGFRIWTHYNYACDHFAELELNGVVKTFRELMANG